MNLERTRDSRLREEVFSARLSSGLRAHVLPRRGVSRKAAVFSTRYGSIDLVFSPEASRPPAPTPPGIAHFLEHQLFKKQDMDVLMEFGRFGAASNAFTDYTSTTYYFAGTEQFEECLELLIRLVFAPHFTVEGVAKEKLIIEQELRMYDDQPDYRAYKNLMASLYREHPVRMDIGGTVQTIQEIDRDLLDRCWRRFYHPANMWFVASGDLDPAKVIAQVDRALPPSRFGTGGAIDRRYPAEPAGPSKGLVRESAVVSRPKVLVGFKDLSLNPGDLLDRDLGMSVLLDLLFGPTSAFHSKWFAKGLIDDSFGASYQAEEEFGVTLIGGETDEPERLAEEIRRELTRARRGRFAKRDVERARRKRMGRYVRSFDNPEGAAFMLLGAVMHDLSPFDIPRALSRLSPSSIAARLKSSLPDDAAVVSIVDPRRN